MCRFRKVLNRINWRLLFVCIFCFAAKALAQEGENDWRATYDIFMMWINFFILVILFIKFGKKPIKNYLKGQKEEVSDEITGLEGQRNDMLRRIKDMGKEMEESRIRFQEIKEKIISQGEAKKQQIIEEAELQSRVMLEDAQRRIENRILSAKKDVHAQLVDEAVELAFQSIGRYITDEDNRKFLQQFLDSAAFKQPL
ncbi:MAG: ATP synthase F0 subunit B [Desulfobacterales bacterium]